MRILIPNVLGYMRLALGVIFFLLAWEGMVYTASIVFLTAMATDILDGFLARRLGQVTKQGIVLDAFSDKFVLVLAYVYILLQTVFPIWIAAVAILYHVFTLIGLAILYRSKRKILEHAWAGKLAAFAQTILVPVVVVGWYATPFGQALTWVMVAATLLAVVVYSSVGLKAMQA